MGYVVREDQYQLIHQGASARLQVALQLRYMLMSAAIHQGTAVGVLICAKRAVLEKCIASKDKVNFQRNVYDFGEDSLVAVMENLLKDIYCNFVQ